MLSRQLAAQRTWLAPCVWRRTLAQATRPRLAGAGPSAGASCSVLQRTPFASWKCCCAWSFEGAAWAIAAAVIGSLSLNALTGPNPNPKDVPRQHSPLTTKNHAFVLLPPQASGASFRRVVLERLDQAGAVVVEHGALTGRDVDERGIIDTHFVGSALPALSEPPTALHVSDAAQREFHRKFGLPWQEAAATVVFNSTEYGWLLDLSADKLLAQWNEAQASGQVVEVAPGVSCALLRDGLYAINPFYPALRRQFTHGQAKLWWCVVEFDAKTLPWKTFNEEVVGGIQAEARRQGFGASVHASRSPTEGLKDRVVWLGQRPELDYFGKQVVDCRGPRAALEAWVRGGQEREFDGLDSRDLIEALGLSAA